MGKKYNNPIDAINFNSKDKNTNIHVINAEDIKKMFGGKGVKKK